jgi:hypothetical protein
LVKRLPTEHAAIARWYLDEALRIIGGETLADEVTALVASGRAEILPALRLLRRGGRNAPRVVGCRLNPNRRRQWRA